MSKSDKRCKRITLYLFAVIFSLSSYALAEPLHDAAKEGSLEKVTRLVEEGSDVNIRTDTGATPLHFAAYRGHKDVAEFLILKGVDINSNSTDER